MNVGVTAGSCPVLGSAMPKLAAAALMVVVVAAVVGVVVIKVVRMVEVVEWWGRRVVMGDG